MPTQRLIIRRWRSRARIAQAMALVTIASALQRWIAMPKWARVIGEMREVPPDWKGAQVVALRSSAATMTEHRVASAISRACEILPGEPRCLAQAVAGQIMLRRRKEPGVVVIGLRRAESATGWEGHAWLLGAHGALTGGPAANGFTPTTVFAPIGVEVPALPHRR